MALSKLNESDALQINFLNTVQEISGLAREIGIQIRPYYAKDLPFFNTLSSQQKKSVTTAALSYLQVCQQTKCNGHLADSRAFVWNGIKSLGLRPTSDLFHYLGSEDIIEIHDFSARQLFRNFNYFKYSSYDLESLFCRDIHQLFSYEESSIKYLLQWFAEIESGRWFNMRNFEIPPTEIKELKSPLLYELKVEFVMGGPLFDSLGKPAATISIERAKIEKSAAKSALEEEALVKRFYGADSPLSLREC